MKIVSRIDTDHIGLEHLQEVVKQASFGKFMPSDDIVELAEQVDLVCAAMIDLISSQEASILTSTRASESLRSVNGNLTSQINILQTKLAEIKSLMMNGISYDEDLEHATIDTMEAIMASGASDVTFDGELCFKDSITLKKEDFKPFVKQGIDTYLRLKAQSLT